MFKKLCSIAISLIAIAGTFISCTTTVPEYVYVEPKPIVLPDLENYIQPDLLFLANKEPEVVKNPLTVNDVIYNMGVYKEYYEAERDIRRSLEKYIKEVNAIIGDTL